MAVAVRRDCFALPCPARPARLVPAGFAVSLARGLYAPRDRRRKVRPHCKLPSPYRAKTNGSRVSFHTFVVVHRYSESCFSSRICRARVSLCSLVLAPATFKSLSESKLVNVPSNRSPTRYPNTDPSIRPLPLRITTVRTLSRGHDFHTLKGVTLCSLVTVHRL